MWQYDNSAYLIHAMHQQEWDNHKYIDKIKTKAGKFRYIYELPQNRQKTTINSTTSFSSIGNSIGSSTNITGSNFRLKNIKRYFKYDKKAKEAITKSHERIIAENIFSGVDSYDDIYSSKDIEKYVKNYVLKSLNDIGYKNLDKKTKEKIWKNTIKEMKQSLIEYYNSKPNEFDSYADDEILCMYMQIIMESNGYDINKLSVSHYLQNLGMISEEDVINNNPTSLDDLHKVHGNIDDDEDMAAINRDNMFDVAHDKNSKDEYPDGVDYGYSSNCAFCTLAYELRQRGYDVEASAVSWDSANTLEEIASWYKDENGRDCSFTTAATNVCGTFESEVVEKLRESMLSDVDKNNCARGQLCVYWAWSGGGHSIAYEVNNGEIIIRDCQINKKYTLEEFVDEYRFYIAEANILRTDDKEVTSEALKGVRNSRKWP